MWTGVIVSEIKPDYSGTIFVLQFTILLVNTTTMPGAQNNDLWPVCGLLEVLQ